MGLCCLYFGIDVNSQKLLWIFILRCLKYIKSELEFKDLARALKPLDIYHQNNLKFSVALASQCIELVLCLHAQSNSCPVFRQTLFEFDQKPENKDEEDAYHFVAYLPIDGRLYELDGLKEGPVDLGPIPPDTDWVDAMTPILEAKISQWVLFLTCLDFVWSCQVSSFVLSLFMRGAFL